MDTLSQDDALGRQMCNYFISLNQKMKDLEKDVETKFKEFNSNISKLSSEEQKKYEKFKNMMDEVGGHYGEGDWPVLIHYGEEFGSHYLGYHLNEDPDCCYCSDNISHAAGEHDITPDMFCVHCKSNLQMKKQEKNNNLDKNESVKSI